MATTILGWDEAPPVRCREGALTIGNFVKCEAKMARERDLGQQLLELSFAARNSHDCLHLGIGGFARSRRSRQQAKYPPQDPIVVLPFPLIIHQSRQRSETTDFKFRPDCRPSGS